MKRTINSLILIALLTTAIFWITCGDDDNPVAPRELAGTYTFVSLTDKIENFTINAGDMVDLDGPGALPAGALTGTLELTETTFTFTFTITPAGAAPITLTASGTYTISGSTLTAVTIGSTVPGLEVGTETLEISLSGNRLTLEDDETKLVFDKQ
jgi:heat shock protein HslJ